MTSTPSFPVMLKVLLAEEQRKLSRPMTRPERRRYARKYGVNWAEFCRVEEAIRISKEV